MHFRIHCKQLQKQDYILFHHIFILKKFTQQYEHKIHYSSMFFFYYYKHESKLQQNPKFCWKKNPKTTIKIYGISKQSLWFSTVSTYNSFHFIFQNSGTKNIPLFSRTLSFWIVLSLFIMIKTNKNSKFKLTKFPN